LKTLWLRAVLLVGAVYLVTGLVFAGLAAGAPSQQLRVFWRVVAWGISALAFGVHIAFDQFRLRSSAKITALHAALGVALGAFALAAAAIVRALVIAPGDPRRLLVALVAWPALTGVPAFLVAFAAAAGLSLRRRRDTSSGAA
jgi:hypothetical protein